MYQMAHISVVVKNIDRSRDFYLKALGCHELGQDENERLKFLYLDAHGQTLELLQYQDNYVLRERGPIDHIAFWVDDIEKAVVIATAQGASMVFKEPKIMEDKRIIFITGPDGERIEFMEKL